MNTYTRNNPPKRGNARRIFTALQEAGYTVLDLHYNANLWGRGEGLGWGTWACRVVIAGGIEFEAHCGIYEGKAYIRGYHASGPAIELGKSESEAK